MSGYDTLIEKLKKKLEAAGSVESEIAKQYSMAKEEAKKRYEESRASLLKNRDGAIAEAAASKLKAEKDIAQFHEARGLTRSGEAIDEALNRELIEANAIRDTMAEHSEGEEKLKKQLDDEVAALESAELKDIQGKKEKLEDEILELEKQKLKEGDSVVGEDGGTSGGGGDSLDDYEPSISESMLATRLFNMFKNSDGKLSSDGSRELQLYVEKLREDNGLSDEYMKNLLFALKSYGYDPADDGDDEIDGTFESILRAANNSSAKVEDMMYRFYRGRGAKDGEAMAEAKKHALWAKLDVIYKNSTSREQFIYYARKSGSSMSTIYRYFDRIEDVNKYDIGGGIYLKEK